MIGPRSVLHQFNAPQLSDPAGRVETRIPFAQNDAIAAQAVD
jgi:hypothetical protein